MAAPLIATPVREKKVFKARPRPERDPKALINHVFDGFERTFEGLAK